MVFLLLFAFISGLVTIAAPCIWPLLPVILSSASTGEKRKPFGITLGIAVSFIVFTLSISYLVKLFPIDPNVFRLFSVLVIGFLGLSLVIPKLSAILESWVSRLTGTFSSKLPQNTHGFWGGFLTGSALGLVWSPCAGPILATIATLASTRSVTIEVLLVTLVYVLGVSIPLLVFAQLGSKIFNSTSALNKYTGKIQQIFGVIMILTALAIYTNYDKIIQAQLLNYFPSYSSFLVTIESNPKVTEALQSLSGRDPDREAGVFSMPNQDSLELRNLGKAPEFTGITQWLNSEPLSVEQLKGKVVLVDFWTYTCINCIRTLPYITEWDAKYRDQGLVIVGMHTPEFEFEKKTENVQKAIEQYAIKYPVAQDNDFATWDAYENRYWPAKYLIDAEGNVRYIHFGEGAYEETEKAIQTLLEEAGATVDQQITSESTQRRLQLISPETYIGSLRMQAYYPDNAVANGEHTLIHQETLPINTFSLSGTWRVSDEYSEALSPQSSLRYHFGASQVFLVMRTADAEPTPVSILLDGKIIEEQQAGADVTNGKLVVKDDRLYHLVDLRGSIEEHTLEIIFESGNVQVFAFTFG